MSNELRDYVETPSEKRRRTLQQTTQSDVNPENKSNLFSSYQSTCFVSSSSTSNSSCNSGTTNGCLLNGCNVKHENNENLRSSAFNGDRAALYRNIYNSSSSDDEDEHCVYTYKGAEAGSDLPASFVHLGMNGQNQGRMSACSSPEMDFLEMDFDPGPSNEQDSDSDTASLYRQSSSYDHQNDLGTTLENIDVGLMKCESVNVLHNACDENANFCTIKPEVLDERSSNLNSVTSTEDTTLREKPCCSKSLTSNNNEIYCIDYTTGPFKTSTLKYYDSSSDEESSASKNSITNPDSSSNSSSCSNQSNKFAVNENVSDRKLSGDSDSEDITFIPSGYDHIEPDENLKENLFENLCDISVINTSANDFISYDDLLPIDPSYSISAVVNVVKILNDVQCSEREKLVNLLRPKQMTESTPLVEYLFMRSVQNANEADLANFASIISESKLHSRFFSTYPDAHFNLVEWLYSWMRKGAVPVVTRNIQERGMLATKNIIRNPWRHNVVYKLESPYIHVLNPYEKVLDCILHSQLSQPSLIYVKRKYILQKWHSKVDLRLLMRANHNRWYNENVLGQVATIIRENDNSSMYTKYVRIPSNCRCGITLFVPSENLTLCREIDEALELTTTACY